jgi:hypothetical protein
VLWLGLPLRYRRIGKLFLFQSCDTVYHTLFILSSTLFHSFETEY